MALEPKTLKFLLVSVGLITLPHINHIPLSLFLFFSLLWGWRLLALSNPRLLPNQWITYLLMLIAVALLYIQHQGFMGRDAGTSLFVTALGLKLLEIKAPRDVYLIIFLSFIIAATQFLFEQSIIMAFYTLFVGIVLLSTLLLINSLTIPLTAAFKTAAIIILQALPIAVLIFILFPRMEPPAWLLFGEQNQGLTGLSDSMEPGSISQLGLSSELAFRVKFEGEVPPPNQRYWRGPVFSNTDGKRWTENSINSLKRLTENIRFSGQSYRYTLLMEPQNNRWVYALEMPAQFDDSLSQNGAYQLISPKIPTQRAEYQVTSYKQYNTGALSDRERAVNIKLPNPPSDRLLKLVNELKGFDGNQQQFIDNLLNYYQTRPFHYTLKPPLMGDKPIETFLLDERRGFCSHYASAFVYLMRIAGIPARVVAGYQGGLMNEIGGFLEVRQANAHAWSEVWLPGQGWKRIDPTAVIAPERVEQDVNIDLQIAEGIVAFSPMVSGNLSWLRQARSLWNSVDYNWQRWVINYDNLSQSDFLSRLGIKTIKDTFIGLIIGVGIISSLIALVMLKSRHRRDDPIVKLFHRFIKKLYPLKRHRGEGAETFSLRAQQQYPNAAKEIAAITRLYYRLRYFPDYSVEELKQFKEQVKIFRL